MTENQSTSIFTNLSRRYFLALSILAIIIIVSQTLVQNYLQDQLGDSRIVNLAGRQRMLSQKLSKEVLQLVEENNPEQRTAIKERLAATQESWSIAHYALKERSPESDLSGKNSATIIEMFDDIEPHYQQMVQSTQLILDSLNQSLPANLSSLQPAITSVLENEQAFLKKMDTIVFQYDKEAKEKVQRLRRIEGVLLVVALLAILLELAFIFRPTARYVQGIIQQLTGSFEETQKQKQEIEELYQEKEQSLRELRALNFAIDQASLFASITLDGTLIYISEKLAKFLGYQNRKPQGLFSEILTDDKVEQEYIEQIIRTRYSKIWNGEISITNQEGQKNWLEISLVPVNRSGVQQDYLILCNDITTRKETEQALQQLNEEQLAEEIRLQKVRSSQIIGAQEEERKRIARDMHDGIGQMLTALKFNLEALNIEDETRLLQRIEELKKLSSNLIKGVRIATFNLTPPELTDYGVGIALAKLCRELSKLTNEQIFFENKTNFNERFDTIIETNVYRITQEAVNNAIKYANANVILVTISHSKELLSIAIQDDGVGFDPAEIAERPVSAEGTNKGLSFMKERVTYINGRLFVHSAVGEGTRITINLPLPRSITPVV
ncbi:MAG: ATP-binding protein [Bacteroidota bacterium]